MSSNYKLTLTSRSINDAEPRAKTGLEGAQKSLGFIPNMYAYMANSPILLDSYLYTYALFRQESSFSPVEQEVVFLTISRENGCHYCVAAHSFVGDAMTKVPAEVTNAIRDGSTIPDTKLQALSEFTKTLLNSRGHPCQGSVAAFLSAGYSEVHILNIVQAISVKVLSNYANHLFDTPLDEIFKGRAWQPACEKSACATKECTA
ncbi:MAG: carboxymuconolactone decarboxylase family protein [Methylotenera sp.]|uniref:carboxymuconolactone decarboxylase family protein n=1 Tax=Methylotenera sp. TaxID=2051956 RepID=UPI0024888EBD|nr:carboxymuconolactone decarboxylase family protein [Methylotenera sp.]MDI1309271.1 carboxymuconolactone decarboxylase family protein [Methylotenera sp.]